MTAPADTTPRTAAATGADTPEAGWICRLFVPWLIWSAAAIAMLYGGPQLAVVSDQWVLPIMRLSLYGFLFISILFVWQATRGGAFPVATAWLAVGAVLCNIVLDTAVRALVMAELLPPLAWPAPERLVVGSMLLLGAAPIFGDLLARAVEDRAHLLPALAVSAAADWWSVNYGVSKLIEKNPEAVQAAVVSFPVAAADTAMAVPMVGGMDWIFIAFLTAFVRKFSLPTKRLVPALAGSIAVGVAVTRLTGAALPLLPFIGAGFAVCYWRHVRPGRREILITCAAFGVMFAVFSLIHAARSQ